MLSDTAPHSGATSSTLTLTDAPASLHGARYRAVVSGFGDDGSAASHAAILTVRGAAHARPGALHFGAVKNGGTLSSVTSAQTVAVSFAGAGADWLAASDAPWLQIGLASGSDAGSFTVAIVNPPDIIGTSTSLTGSITISAPTAPNSPLTVPVTLTIAQDGTLTSPPVGVFDTPAEGSTGLTGSIPVTGWALDDVEVRRVRLMRDPVAGEGSAQIFIGDAVLVEGARPDVAALNRTTPTRCAPAGDT